MGALTDITAPRKLRDDDDLSAFSCGEVVVDTWLAKHARHACKRGTAVVYVSFDATGALAGFYTLSAHSMDRNCCWMPTTVRGMRPTPLEPKRSLSIRSASPLRIFI